MLLKAIYGNNIQVWTMTTLFDKVIYPVMTYGAEVWFPFNIKLEKAGRNSSLDCFEMFQKIINSPDATEKLHFKFCRSVLGVHKKTMKMPVLAELGRYPLSFQMIGQAIGFWIHLTEMKQNSCISAVYSDLMKEGSSSYSPWIQFVKNILKCLGFDHVWKNQGTLSGKRLKHAIVNKLFDLYKTFWSNTKQNVNISRFHFYNKVTKCYRMEPYLAFNDFEIRRTMSRFRLSAHDLAVEKGRQQNIPRNDRLCKMCGVIEDEEHLLNECSIYQNERQNFLANIPSVVLNVNSQISFLPLMCDDRVQTQMAIYVNKCFTLRKAKHMGQVL